MLNMHLKSNEVVEVLKFYKGSLPCKENLNYTRYKCIPKLVIMLENVKCFKLD